METNPNLDPNLLVRINNWLNKPNVLKEDKLLIMELHEKLNNAFQKLENYDYELAHSISQIGGVDIKKYPNIIEDIRNGAFVLYYAKTGQYVKYIVKQSEKKLFKHIAAFKDHTNILQVVPHNVKQKLFIIYEHDDYYKNIDIVVQLKKLKQYIFDFLTKKMKTNILIDDITIHKFNSNKYMFIINATVNSLREKDEIKDNLIRYIMQIDESYKMVKNILCSAPFGKFYNDSDDEHIIKIKSQYYMYQINLTGTATEIGALGESINYKDLLATALNYKQMPQIMVNINPKINEVETITLTREDNININIKKFIDHIKKDKPIWYVNNKEVSISLIREKFNELTKLDISSCDKIYIPIIKKIIGTEFRKTDIDGKINVAVLTLRSSDTFVETILDGKEKIHLNLPKIITGGMPEKNPIELKSYVDTSSDQVNLDNILSKFAISSDKKLVESMVYFIVGYDMRYNDWKVALDNEKIINIKIGGTTNNAECRIRDMQTGCPFKLICIKTISLNENYHKLEHKLHIFYKSYSTIGEWFRLPINEINKILSIKSL
jgi:hypothetical protein